MADNNVKLTITALDETQRAFVNLKASLKQLEGDLGQVTTASMKTSAANSKLSESNDSLVKSFSSFKAALPIAALTITAAALLDAGKQAEKLRNSFEVAAGGITAGTNAMAFVRGESERLGLDLQNTAGSFLKLSAAAKGTSLEGAKTQQIFTSVAGAGRSLGLSSDEMNGALLAISQMMSKGTVQAEELRGQLGERLPGAFQIASRAMGVSTAELGKMLEQGKVVSDDFLPKFAVELQKTFPPGEKAVSGLTAETERLKNAWFDLKVAVMENGGESLFSSVARGIAAATKEMGYFVKSLDSTGAKLGAVITPGFSYIASITSGAKDAKKPLQPLSGMDQAYLGLLGSGGYTSSTNWLMENATIKSPVLGPMEISSDSKLVQNRAIHYEKEKKERQPAAASVSGYNSFVESFNSAQVQAEQDTYVRGWMELDKKYSDLEQKYSALSAKEKSELSKIGINQSRIDTLKEEAGIRLAAEELEKVNRHNHKEEEEWRKAEVKDIKERYEYEQNKIKEIEVFRNLETDLKNPYDRQVDLLNKYYIEKKQIIDQFEAINAEDEKRRADARIALDLQVKDKKIQIEMQKWEQVGGIISGQLGQLAGMMDQSNAEQFAAWKALAIAQATIATAMAISGILANESLSKGMLAIPLAITAGAIGAAQVAMIAAQEYKGREFGGPVIAGQSYLVGEKRPEIFTPSQSGWITPRADGGSGGVTQNITIDARGADAGVLARIDAAMRKAREDAKTDIMNSLNRGGAYSRAVGRA